MKSVRTRVHTETVYSCDTCRILSSIVCIKTNVLLGAPFYVNNCVCFLFSHSAIYDVVEEKADSEPDFQYIPEKSPQDPTQLDQHALRDSMVVLKEGLGSGAILAQFDVRLRNEHKQKHTWLLSVHTTVGECCLDSEVWLNNKYFVVPALNPFVYC